MKKIFSLLGLFVLVSCTSQKGDTLVVGIDAEFPPFGFLIGDIVTGLDLDLIKAIGKEMGRPVKIGNLLWEESLSALQNKEIDVIIAGMTVTEERKTMFNFSDTYYISQSQMLLVQKDNTDITSMDSLVGKKVGAMLGFTGDTLVSSIEGVTVERYSTAYQAITSLTKGKIDAVILDYEPAQKYAQQTPTVKLISGNNAPEEYAIALRKEDTQLLAEINKALATVKEKGIYDKIYTRYFPKDK